MKNWTTELAITEIRGLIEDLSRGQDMGPGSAAHIRWFFNTTSLLEEVFGPSSKIYNTFRTLKWHHVGTRVVTYWEREEPDMGAARYDNEAYRKTAQVALGILQAGLDQLEKHGIDAVYEGKNSSKEASSIIEIVNIVERKLRKVIRDKPESQKRVQDAVEDLLVGADLLYKREYPSIAYSSKQYKPDFSFQHQQLVLEVKFCNRSGREKELIAEINDDIMAYKQQFPNLLFVIYDTGYIRDVGQFASEFEGDQGVLVRVVKH